MQIVIKMSEERFRDIQRIAEVQTERKHFKTAEQIIASGTPLPERHGRLIIEPTKEEIEKTVGGINDFADYGRDCVKAVLDNAKTIIEADTESGGEE